MNQKPAVVRSEPGPNWRAPDEVLVQVSSPDPGMLLVTTDPPSWTLPVDVSHGDRDLEMVHSPEGRVLWSHPWLCSDNLACDGDTVWLIKHVGNQNDPPGATPLELHALRIATGEAVGPACRLRLPAELQGRYHQAWEVNARFAKKGGDVAVVHDEFRIETPRRRVPHVLATVKPV